jgi:hypothetical protein
LPRGADEGVVQVVDNSAVRLDDLSGNNLIWGTHRNMLANGRARLLGVASRGDLRLRGTPCT